MRQPWLNDRSDPVGRPPRPDDFIPGMPTLPLRRVVAGLLPVFVLLLMGRSGPLLDALYGLPLLPGTETLIALAEGWHGAMRTIGVTAAMEALQALLRTGR